jgi:hypothetical protein
MKTMLLVSTLAGIVAATPSFAQSPPNSYSPAFGYSSYAAPGTHSPNVNAPESFGAWVSGATSDGTAQARSRNRQ